MKLTIQDATAALVAVILSAGSIWLAIAGMAIPAELAGPLGMALTWLFVRSAMKATNGGPGT